jgi:hypothetical protein
MEAVMKKVIRLVLAFTGTILCLGSAEASNQPTTFIGPTLHGTYTAPLTDMTAYSLGGEFGVKNFRLGATLGYKFDQSQRIKLTGEYLWQNINYHFNSGDNEHWVGQGAVGGRYEYNFMDIVLNPEFDLNAYYSHASSEDLSNRAGIITVNGAPTTTILNLRRIAGSDAGGISPGLAIAPWQGGRIEVDANYDNVSYNTQYTTNHDTKGFGGTVHFNQTLSHDLVLGLSYANRSPFNDYEGNLDWTNVQYYGRWTLGFYSNYIEGKNLLPNTWNIGLSADYFMDPIAATPMKGENLKDEITITDPNNFLDWTADPAVHMPQVLAIADEKILIPDPYACIAPTLSGVDLTRTVPLGTITYINATAAFNGKNLNYSFSTDDTAGADVAGNAPFLGYFTVNTISGGLPGFTFTVTVTASNSCGSATTSFDVTTI